MITQRPNFSQGWDVQGYLLHCAYLCLTPGVYTRKGEFCYVHQGSLIIYGRHQKQMVKYLALAVSVEYKEHAVGQKVPAGE